MSENALFLWALAALSFILGMVVGAVVWALG